MSPIMYYASQSYITDPGIYAELFDNLPANVSVLCQIIQGLILAGLIRDLAALNRHELLCQDVWGLADVEDEKQISEDDRIVLDKVAQLTLSGDDTFPQLQKLFERDSRLRVFAAIKCYTQSGVKMVDLIDITQEQTSQ